MNNTTTTKDELEFNWIEWATEGVSILIIGIIGLAGNIISIWTFSKQQVHRIFHNLLLVLAIFDILYVACSIHLFSLRNFWPDYDQEIRIPSLPILIPIAQIGLMGSVYCTVALTLERFLAVCYPFLHRRHVYSTRTFVIPVIVFTIVYNVPKFFELALEYIPMDYVNTLEDEANLTEILEHFEWDSYNGTVTVKLIPTDLRLNRLYIRIYILWMNLIVQILGPFLVLIILNIRVYTRIKKFEEALQNDALRVCFTRQPSTNGATRGTSVRVNSRLSDNADNNVSGQRNSQYQRHLSANAIVSVEEPSSSTRRSFRMSSFRNPLSKSARFSRQSGSSEANGNNDQQSLSRKRSHHNHAPRRREVQLSRISIYIVFMFVICHSVRLIPNTYEMAYTYSQDYEKSLLPWPTWVAIITNLSHVLLTLVCSSNFFIYYFKHGNFCRRNRKNGNHANDGEARGEEIALNNVETDGLLKPNRLRRDPSWNNRSSTSRL